MIHKSARSVALAAERGVMEKGTVPECVAEIPRDRHAGLDFFILHFAANSVDERV